MTKINLASINQQINRLPEEEKKPYKELLDTEIKLSKKCDDVKVIDKKISKTSARIKETSYEVQHRSLGRRVGYGFAGTAVATLLCPISWTVGILLSILSLPGAMYGRGKISDTKPLFVAPVRLCSNLFAKATWSKEKWEASLEESTQEKNTLSNKRLEAFSEVNLLNEQMKKQMIKITEVSADKIPTLLHEAISIGEKVKHLSDVQAKSNSRL